jgi:hypothetical protein
MARTRVTNQTGEARYFGYIPPHGAQLADGGEVVVDGDLRTVLASGRGRFARPSEMAALDADIEAGNVTVEAAPEVSSSSSSSA